MLIDRKELQEALMILDSRLTLMYDEVKKVHWLMSIDSITSKDKWLKIDYETLSKDYAHKKITDAAMNLYDKWSVFVNTNYRAEKTARKNLETFYDNCIE